MPADSRVLIVDDEQDVADSYANALNDEHSVAVAYSGEGALSALDDRVDVMLLDRRMPDLSGDEVLEAVQDRSIDCRVVMVTAVDPTIDIVEMEFDEYLVKPVTSDQLQDVVERMLVRETLDEQVQRMFVLASKLATLESKLTYDQLEQSQEYEALRAEFDSLRSEVELPESTDDPYLEATIEKVQALLDERV
jgi:two-component system response regulator AdeR